MSMVATKKNLIIFLCETGCNSADALVEFLTDKDFDVQCLPESGPAVDQIILRVPDIVILDANIPPAGGYEVCKEVRPYYSGPILFMGREESEAAQLLAYERGADDYIVKPVSPALMAAKISAHLRRGRGSDHPTKGRRIRAGKLIVDATRREVSLAGEPVDLTTIQFDLFWYLARRSGRVVSRQELYEALFRQKYNGFDRSVDVYISRIRNQLGDNPENPNFLKTVRGVGYLFVGQEKTVGHAF
jgi:DNA-binding response OmpR family regulator